MLKYELKKHLQKLGIHIIKGKYIKKTEIQRVLGEHYKIPSIPNELKHAVTPREKQYLRFINELIVQIRQDPMTGMSHKEHFKSFEKDSGVFIMIDGDNLKDLNDKYGHDAGHAAILAISDGIKKATRKDAITSRFGGDEFMTFIPNVSIATGVQIANRILEAIHKMKISDYYNTDKATKKELEKVPLKASIGVGYNEEDADKALYKSKRLGKDRIEFHKETLKLAA